MSWLSQSMQARVHESFCTFSTGLSWITYWFFQVWNLLTTSFVELCLDTVHMSVSWSSNKCIYWDTAVGIFFVTQATCYSSSGYILLGHDKPLRQWTCTTSLVVLHNSEWHVECLPFSTSFSFILFTFSFQHGTSFGDSLSCNRVQSLYNPSSWCGYHYRCYTQSFYSVVEPGHILSIRFILPCGNSRSMQLCCIKWPFSYLVMWLPYIWIIACSSFFM